MYGNLENIQIITLAPELSNALSVIDELSKQKIVVSVGIIISFVLKQNNFCVLIFFFRAFNGKLKSWRTSCPTWSYFYHAFIQCYVTSK